MPAVDPEKRRRRWARKVRTGCNTCKTRRKKCDETRPYCLRCINGRYSCDGYDTSKPWLISTSFGGDSVIGSLKSKSPTNLQPVADIWPRCPQYAGDHSQVLENITASHDVLDIGLKPSDHWASGPDAWYIEFYVHQVVPLLATTREWRHFWSFLVPQISWSNEVIHHAMVALAAAYESNISGVDRKELILRKSNQAISSFRTQQHASVDIALVLCRLFESIARCTHDSCSAMMHTRSGSKIIREAGRQIDPDIIRIMALTFLGATACDHTHNVDHVVYPALHELDTIRLEYQKLLGSLCRRHQWFKLHSASRSFILTSCAIMTQAICAAIHPDILTFRLNDFILPVDRVHAALVANGTLLSAAVLKDLFSEAFERISTCLEHTSIATTLPSSLQQLIKTCVDNFVVQIATIEPRMTAGTFWQDDYEVQCLIESHFGNIGNISVNSSPGGLVPECKQEKREFFLEHVCPYRSGYLIPFSD